MEIERLSQSALPRFASKEMYEESVIPWSSCTCAGSKANTESMIACAVTGNTSDGRTKIRIISAYGTPDELRAVRTVARADHASACVSVNLVVSYEDLVGAAHSLPSVGTVVANRVMPRAARPRMFFRFAFMMSFSFRFPRP